MNFSQSINNDIALDIQIRSVLGTIGGYRQGHDYYNFRCPVCGDSKKSKSKKRGYILKNKKPWMFYCHNCFIKMPAVFLLKDYFPTYYRDYIDECIRLNKQDEEPEVKNPTIKPRKNINKDNKHTKYFVPILKKNDKIFKLAIDFCKRRKIPESIWKKWFVATDGMYKNRIIIPFFDNKNKIYYYQGRALYDWMTPKYLSRKGDYNSVFNYYNVNKSKPIIVFEGCIDSMFVKNSIALTGLKIDDLRLKDFSNKYFILDDDEEGIRRSIQMLERGEIVFLWSQFKQIYKLPSREKWDMNDVILYLNRDKFSFEELESYFSKSIFDKIFLIRNENYVEKRNNILFKKPSH